MKRILEDKVKRLQELSDRDVRLVLVENCKGKGPSIYKVVEGDEDLTPHYPGPSMYDWLTIYTKGWVDCHKQHAERQKLQRRFDNYGG